MPSAKVSEVTKTFPTENDNKVRISRRSFMRNSAVALGGLAVAGAFESLMAAPKNGRKPSSGSGYGPLVPAVDKNTGLPLLLLPKGFSYESFGWAGDSMSDGGTTPPAHDGMGVTRSQGARVWLTRNHEIPGSWPIFNSSSITYDPTCLGGTTNLLFNTSTGQWEESWLSITGTSTNCAGGITPWGTWLTCEETVDEYYGMTHGWVFEVPAISAAVPRPLKAMGRFVHEAVVVDPVTGYVYETEDRSTAGFYRFNPYLPGKLDEGGVLQMLKVTGINQANLTGSVGVGAVFPVEWVTIDDPERAHSPGATDKLGVYKQGYNEGAATFRRLEGAWYNNGSIYFNSTSGGSAGQVWEYNPGLEQLRLIFESSSKQMLDSPDNITVSTRGGILLCEDGDGSGNPKRLMGLTGDGKIYPFAQNNVVLNGEKNGFAGNFTKMEWAGATFSPDGKWLFVNIQTPGITFAITGNWRKGPL